jgi:hypothetical protein
MEIMLILTLCIVGRGGGALVEEEQRKKKRVSSVVLRTKFKLTVACSR